MKLGFFPVCEHGIGSALKVIVQGSFRRALAFPFMVNDNRSGVKEARGFRVDVAHYWNWHSFYLFAVLLLYACRSVLMQPSLGVAVHHRQDFLLNEPWRVLGAPKHCLYLDTAYLVR